MTLAKHERKGGEGEEGRGGDERGNTHKHGRERVGERKGIVDKISNKIEGE